MTTAVEPTPLAAADHQSALSLIDGFADLRLLAENLDDQQRHRIRVANRLGKKADGSAQVTGVRVPEEFSAGQLELVERAEKLAREELTRCYHRVVPKPIIEWQQSMFGIGESNLARLLGHLGHPRLATPYHWEGEGEDRVLVPDPVFERTLRQLYAYCGYGDPERKRQRGMSVEEAMLLGSPMCKKLVHVLAIPCMRTAANGSTGDSEAEKEAARSQPESPEPITDPIAKNGAAQDAGQPNVEATTNGSAADRQDDGSSLKSKAKRQTARAGQPKSRASAETMAADRRYRAVYDEAKAEYAEREDWTAGHRHNAALRRMKKAILRDLWVVSALE